MCESVQRIVNDRPDSLEIGTPSKGGAVKVYFNADSPPDVAQQLIDAALAARAYANQRLAEQEARP